MFHKIKLHFGRLTQLHSFLTSTTQTKQSLNNKINYQLLCRSSALSAIEFPIFT